MNGRRPLFETLSDIASGLMDATALGPVHARSIDLNLPLDIRLPVAGGDLMGDLPLFRMRTAFDTEPVRLHMVLQEVLL